MIEACVFYSLIGALDPKLAFNDGMRDVVKFVYAPNTVTNAARRRRSAPIRRRTRSSPT